MDWYLELPDFLLVQSGSGAGAIDQERAMGAFSMVLDSPCQRGFKLVAGTMDRL